jgi:mRNA interferase RelE/StbE
MPTKDVSSLINLTLERGKTSPSRKWQIEITRTAEKKITKLSRAAQKSIQRFLRERLLPAENPRQWGKPLRGEKRDLWRYRIGDYRLICDIQDEKIVILVIEIGHRKDVYR